MKSEAIGGVLSGAVFSSVLALTCAPALAQDSLFSGVVGLGASYGPVFPGSDESDTGFIPILDVEIGRYGFVNQYGIGLKNDVDMARGRLSYGAAIGYDFSSRLAEDDVRLVGLPDVESGALATLFLEYDTGPLAYGLEVQRGLSDTGHEGTTAKIYGTYNAQVNERLRLSATPYAMWADDAWMAAFFTVTPAQSMATGLQAFEAGSGIAQAGLSLTGRYALSPRTILFAQLDVSTLAGDAKDSSISFDDTQTSISAGLIFPF